LDFIIDFLATTTAELVKPKFIWWLGSDGMLTLLLSA